MYICLSLIEYEKLLFFLGSFIPLVILMHASAGSQDAE